MKIYVLGSNSFVYQMVQAKNDLVALGVDAWIHSDYEAMVKAQVPATDNSLPPSEHAQIKRENNYLKVHYQHICQSDAILIVNGDKQDTTGYIGGNVLIEMGQAYVNDKQIFLLNDLPSKSPYLAEIESMNPICLHGQINQLLQYQ